MRATLVAMMVMLIAGAWLPIPAADVTRMLGDADLWHPLGFDEVGRSLLPQLWRSTGLSLVIAISAAIVSTLIAVLLGVVAAHSHRRRGWIDVVVLRAADTAAALPVLPLFVIVGAVLLQNSSLQMRMTIIIVGLGLCGWPSLTRVVRGLTIDVLSGLPVRAAVGFGASSKHIVRVHVLPALLPLLFTHAVGDVAGNLVSEAALSLLGVGLTPPDSTLGTMVAAAWPVLSRDPPLVLLPLLTMIMLSLALQQLSARSPP